MEMDVDRAVRVDPTDVGALEDVPSDVVVTVVLGPGAVDDEAEGDDEPRDEPRDDDDDDVDVVEGATLDDGEDEADSELTVDGSAVFDDDDGGDGLLPSDVVVGELVDRGDDDDGDDDDNDDDDADDGVVVVDGVELVDGIDVTRLLDDVPPVPTGTFCRR